MTSQDRPPARFPAWLVVTTGDQAGTRYRLQGESFLVGRGTSNDLIPEGVQSAFVSKRHAEIIFCQGSYRLIDLKSRNGTFVNGQPIEESDLQNRDRVQFGAEGPEFEFLQGQEQSLDETVLAGSFDLSQSENTIPAEATRDGEHELREAVQRARAMRGSQGTGQTLLIMRNMLQKQTRLSRRKLQFVALALTVPLLAVSLYAWRTHQQLQDQKDNLDEQIGTIEVALASARDPEQIEVLINQLDQYQAEAREIQRNVLYSLGLRDQQADFIESEIQRLMADLGASQYSIPGVFQERVRHYIELYQGPNSAHLERALGKDRTVLEEMREIFAENNLPPDLAFMTIVESAFRWDSVNSNGAAGPWQLLPATARAFGLTVSETVDERLDVAKSTTAAARYLRRLISEFGAGTSAMLALAAYNLGPTRVRRVVRDIEDPIKQRSFWYLYRNRTLPAETREYIPKIVAVIILLRNPGSFGLEQPL